MEDSNQTTPQGEKGVNDGLEGSNQTTPQVKKEQPKTDYFDAFEELEEDNAPKPEPETKQIETPKEEEQKLNFLLHTKTILFWKLQKTIRKPLMKYSGWTK